MGEKGEGSGGEGGGKWGRRGGKWGEWGRELGIGYPPVHPLAYPLHHGGSFQCCILMSYRTNFRAFLSLRLYLSLQTVQTVVRCRQSTCLPVSKIKRPVNLKSQGTDVALLVIHSLC